MELKAEPATNSPLADTPPNRVPSVKKVAPTAADRAKPDVELIIKALDKAYTSVGLGLAIVSREDGRVIVANSTELARSWRDLLENDAKLRAKFKKMIAGSGWGIVIAAHLAVALPIIQNHEESFAHLFKSKRVAERD